jgi:hypothetical protein
MSRKSFAAAEELLDPLTLDVPRHGIMRSGADGRVFRAA